MLHGWFLKNLQGIQENDFFQKLPFVTSFDLFALKLPRIQ